MTCNLCGAFVPEGAIFCGNCGAAWKGTAFVPSAGAAVQQPPVQQTDLKKFTPAGVPAGLDRRSFVRACAVNRKLCSAAAIIGYACALISVLLIIMQWMLYVNVYSLIEIVPMVVLCVLLHVLKSRVCAILILVYSIINTLISILIYSTFAGWWLIVAGVLGVIGAFGCQKEWKRYQAAQTA